MKRAVKANFDRSSESYQAYESQTHRFESLARCLQEAVATRCKLEDTLLLDAGAGTGASSRVFKEAVDGLIALDISRPMLRANPAIHCVQGDIEQLPINDDRFGVVIFSASLFLIPEPRQAIREAVRVLEPDGLIAAVVMLGWERENQEDFFSSLDRESRGPVPPGMVADALQAELAVESGILTFETSGDAVRAFHGTAAGAARLFPKLPPEERIDRAQEVLAEVEGPLKQRWQWFVGTPTDGER